MKKTFAHILYCTGLLFISLTARSQSIALKIPQTHIVIDGDKKEWDDNLIYNAEKHIYYNLANDKQNLYLVIKTDDETQQTAILSGGVTFSIDTKGRKKTSYSTTFPLSVHDSYKGPAKTLEEKRLRADMAQLKKIGVKGFKDIDTKELDFENTTGIQTDVNFDDNGTLIYEEAIPLKLFRATEELKNEWAFNIKINALMSDVPQAQQSLGYATVTTTIVAVPAGSGPPNVSLLKGSGLPPAVSKSNIRPSEVEVSKAIDFWGTFTLADVK